MKKKAAKVPNEAKIAKLVRELLVELGENPERDGLRKTPLRVAKSLSFLTRGYRQDIAKVVNGARFKSGTNHMVILKDIELYSLCEHHMLPFYGKCAIGYISRGKVLGVSKLARIVDMFARRLQIQERMTADIAHDLEAHLGAAGVAVVVQATHSCMTCRGVRKPGASMVTSSMLGVFRTKPEARAEVLALLR
jgi:GTP cyclohydrolase I